jgi:hypothetical protein
MPCSAARTRVRRDKGYDEGYRARRHRAGGLFRAQIRW